MGEMTIWDRIRERIGEISFRVFLWSNGTTEEKYLTHVYEVEAERRLINAIYEANL